MSFFARVIFCTLIFLPPFTNGFAQNADIDLLRNINLNRNQHWDGGMRAISNTEAFIGIGMPVSVCIAAYLKSDKILLQKGINMSLALGASSISTFVIKRIVNRKRPSFSHPDIQAIESDQYYSFPSGHTSNAFVTATSLSLNFKKWYVVVPAYTWAVLVAYSRMHLGAHYPSDVAAGAVLGATSAYATFFVNKKLKKYFENKYLKNHPKEVW